MARPNLAPTADPSPDAPDPPHPQPPPPLIKGSNGASPRTPRDPLPPVRAARALPTAAPGHPEHPRGAPRAERASSEARRIFLGSTDFDSSLPPPEIPAVPSAKTVNPVCIIPGHAVKGVEIVGGCEQALDALAWGRAPRGVCSFAPASPSGCRGPSSPIRADPGGDGSRARGGVSLEFLREYSNPAAERRETRGTGASHASSSAATRAGADLGMGTKTTPPGNGGEDDARLRRRAIRRALEAARMPVQEVTASNGAGEPTLLVMGCVRIRAPYTPDACECANETVLARVRGLVRVAA